MDKKPATVAAYLAALPPDRRAELETVRRVILDNLDDGYEEGIQYGMIGYYVPHRVYPPGYHCDPRQPLPFGGLAARKGYLTVSFMSLYGDGPELQRFRKAWAKTGKKLDMGAACIRFRKAEDLALEVLGEAVRRATVKAFIAHYEAAFGPKKKVSASTAPSRRATPASRRSSRR